MTPTGTRPVPAVRPARRTVLGGLLLMAAMAIAAPVIGTILAFPPHEGRLTVTNRSVYQLNVEVRPADGDGWLDLGTVSREGAKTLYEIGDQGRRWLFRFSYAGVHAGQLSVARSDLEREGWRLTIPDEVAERLRAAGLAPSVK